MENKKQHPIWMIALPSLVGIGYFAYSYGYKKYDFVSSMLVAGLLAGVSSTPLLIRLGEIEKTAAAQGQVDLLSANAQMNTLPKQDRQAMIDYIVERSSSFDPISTMTKKMSSQKDMRAAYNTLTNDELKVMFLVYKFAEDKAKLIEKYGEHSSDGLAKQVAEKEYSVIIPSSVNMKRTAEAAIKKYNIFLAQNQG